MSDLLIGNSVRVAFALHLILASRIARQKDHSSLTRPNETKEQGI